MEFPGDSGLRSGIATAVAQVTALAWVRALAPAWAWVGALESVCDEHSGTEVVEDSDLLVKN